MPSGSRTSTPRTDRLPDAVRVAERDGYTWVTNFGTETVEVDAPDGSDFVVVGPTLDGFDVAVVDAAPPELSFR